MPCRALTGRANAKINGRNAAVGSHRKRAGMQTYSACMCTLKHKQSVLLEERAHQRGVGSDPSDVADGLET